MLKKMARRQFKLNHLSLLLKLKVLTYFTPQRSVWILSELKADTLHTHPCLENSYNLIRAIAQKTVCHQVVWPPPAGKKGWNVIPKNTVTETNKAGVRKTNSLATGQTSTFSGFSPNSLVSFVFDTSSNIFRPLSMDDVRCTLTKPLFYVLATEEDPRIVNGTIETENSVPNRIGTMLYRSMDTGYNWLSGKRFSIQADCGSIILQRRMSKTFSYSVQS